MVLHLEINGITQTERCIRSQNNDGPRFRRDTGVECPVSYTNLQWHFQSLLNFGSFAIWKTDELIPVSNFYGI